MESKLHKNILVDCVFINSMLKMTLIINYAEQFKVPPLNKPIPPHPRPGSYAPALLIEILRVKTHYHCLGVFLVAMVTARSHVYHIVI